MVADSVWPKAGRRAITRHETKENLTLTKENLKILTVAVGRGFEPLDGY